MSGRSLSGLKAAVALVAAVIILIVVFPQMRDIVDRSVPDHGARPLITVTTSGGDRDYQMRVRNYVDEDGDYRFVVSMVADDVTYGAEGNTFLVNVEIALAVSDPQLGMSCGPGEGAVETVDAAALTPGAQHMLRVDAVSARNAALQLATLQPASGPGDASGAPGSAPAHTDGSLDSLLAQLTIHRFEADLWLLDDEYQYTTGAADGGAVWAIECNLDKELVWRASDPSRPLEHAEASLFAPEFDFGPQGTASDHQRDMAVTISLTRAPKMELLRAYPEPIVRSRDWFVTFEHQWIGALTEEGNFGFASAPTFLVANRDAAARERNLLLWGGVLLGLAVTLAVRGTSDLADAMLLRKEDDRSERKRQTPLTPDSRGDGAPLEADASPGEGSSPRRAVPEKMRRGRTRRLALPPSLARRHREGR